MARTVFEVHAFVHHVVKVFWNGGHFFRAGCPRYLW